MYTLNDTRKETISRRNIPSVLGLMAVLATLAMTTTVLTFCDNDAANISNLFVSMLTDMASQLYVTIRGVIIPVIIVCVAYAGICAITGGSKGVDQCISILKKCFVAVVIVAFAPLIGQQIGNWVSNSGTGDLGNYNPLH